MLKPPGDRWHSLIFSLRTGYSVILTWMFSELWRWSGPLTYVSLAVAVLTSSLYLGQWQIMAWKVLYSSFFGCLGGYLVALTWATPAFPVVFFIACIILNKISLWDQVSKIFGGLNFVITALMPVGGASYPLESFVYSFLMSMVPTLVVGLSLLVPFPSLAAASCAKKTRSVCRKLCEILVLYTYAFMYPDHSDVYLSEAETLANEVSAVLDALPLLMACVEHEAILFPSLSHVPNRLAAFIEIVRKMIVEFRSMKEAHSRIVPNMTHRRFCMMLEDSMKEALTSMLLAIDIANSDLINNFENLWFEKKKDFVRRSLFHSGRRLCSHAIYLLDWVHVLWVRIFSNCYKRGAFGMQDRSQAWQAGVREAQVELADLAAPKLIKVSSFETERLSQRDAGRLRSGTMTVEVGGAGVARAMNIGHWLDLEFADSVRHRARSGTRSDDGHYSEISGGDLGSLDRNAMNFRARLMSIDADNTNRDGSQEKEWSTSPDLPVFTSFPVTSIDPAAVLLSSFLDSIEFEEIRAHPEIAPETRLVDDDWKDEHVESIIPPVVASAHPVWSRLFLSKMRLSADIERGRLALIFLLNLNALSTSEPLSLQQRDNIKNENLTLGISNEAPRAAFMSRVVLLISLLDQLRHRVHIAEPTVFSLKDFFASKARVVIDFFYNSLLSLCRDALVIVQVLLLQCRLWSQRSEGSETEAADVEKGGKPEVNPVLAEQTQLIDTLTTLFYSYIQPIKISIACTLCATLVIVSSLRESNPNGMWAPLVVVIIRQDNSSSSFLRGMQRLEGTVVGAVFAFGLLKLVAIYYTEDYTSCFYDTDYNFTSDQPEGTCSRGYYAACIAFVMVWITFCAHFREVKNHGYAAAVAAFTPAVLVFGNAGTGGANPEVGAWARVAMTFVGIFVYIIVDNLVYPNRSADFVRANTPTVLAELRLAVAESVVSLKKTLSEDSFLHPSIARTRSSSQVGSAGHASVLKAHEPFRDVPKAVTAIKRQLALRRFRLDLAVLEPSLWYKPFPSGPYVDLQENLDDLCMEIEAVLSAVALLESTKSNVVFAKQDAEGLALICGLSATIIEVSDALNASLNSVSTMLSR